MKKLLLTLGLIGCTLASALAQGTIAFGNTVASRFIMDREGAYVTADAGFTFRVYYGPAGASADALTPAPGFAMIGATTPGVLTGASSVFALPGTSPGEVVSLQIRAFGPNGGQVNNTDIRQVTLAATEGPGTVIWQSFAGTNPNRFHPIVMAIPEPSSIALGVLAGVFLLSRVRKSRISN